MCAQNEEIKQLKDSLKAESHDSERQLEIPSLVLEELKGSHKEFEALNRELLILSERSRVFRNVLVFSIFRLTKIRRNRNK